MKAPKLPKKLLKTPKTSLKKDSPKKSPNLIPPEDVDTRIKNLTKSMFPNKA